MAHAPDVPGAISEEFATADIHGTAGLMPRPPHWAERLEKPELQQLQTWLSSLFEQHQRSVEELIIRQLDSGFEKWLTRWTCNSASHPSHMPRVPQDGKTQLPLEISVKSFDAIVPKGDESGVESHNNNDHIVSPKKMLTVNPELLKQLEQIDEKEKNQKGLNCVNELASALGWQKMPSVEWNQETTGKACTRLKKIVFSMWFDAFFSLMIVLNTVYIGIVSDDALKRSILLYDNRVNSHQVSLEQPGWYGAVDIMFCTIFSVEILFRLLAEELQFISGPNRRWNMFDLFLVITAIVELIFVGFNLTFMRIFRILRTIRALRIIRVVRVFRELRMMLVSVMCCFMPLLWAILFLLVITFVFAVILVSGIGLYVENEDTPSADMVDIARFYFASMPMAILSLFMALTGGTDWFEFGQVLLEIHIFYFLTFIFYICFVVFGILNVITGIFVTGTYEISQLDKDLVIQAEMHKEDSYIYGLRMAFKDCDVSGDDMLTWEEFQKQIQDRKVMAYFRTLGIDGTEAAGLFKLLDLDGSGAVGINEFVMGCMRLKGGAKTVDVATLMYENKLQTARLIKHLRAMDTHMQRAHANLLATLGQPLQ
eukprot:gnl/TRDRNA2_/TRDRNA2_82627_c0_seq1.p1 gnl/TRDRNA2_/TRDRNA2_82627_c0~~gnl/TRDRNA2_/TRDRNA2_82627_c0_seq1.p1  ORF type:complete len:598 (+),score=101.70 gnl/TRDRNA2_/TRDRNA2_82627_c0_seq1:77-1870(+)